MKINRQNYELFFIDYLDGILTDQEIRMLEDFLLINPDLSAELEGTEKIILKPEGITFNNIEDLKKPDLSLPVNESNFEDFCIAFGENDLNEEQSKTFLEYLILQPKSLNVFNLYRKLHLIPDDKIIFPGQEKLKKNIVFIPGQILYPLLSVAAAIALMIILYFNNKNSINQIQKLTAELPASIITNSGIEIKDGPIENPKTQGKKPIIQHAFVIDLTSPKEKKEAVEKNVNESKDKKREESKEKKQAPVQKLNPSFQIKLPSLADNQILVPVIEKGKINYQALNSAGASSQFLSISEFARKQLAEKILNDKNSDANKITAWQIADAGIIGINKLTGGEMKLERKKDVNANISTYSFNSKLLSFSRTSVR